HDREAVQLAGRELRARPQPGKREQAARLGMDPHRSLLLALLLPLEEAIGGGEAARAAQRIAEKPLFLPPFASRLGPERRRAALRSPDRHESPAHHLERTHAVAQRDDRRVLRRCDVEARLPPLVLRDRGIERGFEILDEALLTRKRVTAAHGCYPSRSTQTCR